ncbi:MAG: hypothetical protein ACI9ES_002298 [Oceanospirillaceae bacterium]|jgi:hypothetical protein
MIEEIAAGLVVLLVVIPFLGSQLSGSYGSTYREDFKFGAIVLTVLALVFVVLFLVIGSIMHIAEGGPSIIQLINRIFN